MFNVNKQFQRLELIQSSIGAKLNKLENIALDHSKEFLLNQDYEEYNQKEKLKEDLEKLLKMDDKVISNNYLKFYDFMYKGAGSMNEAMYINNQRKAKKQSFSEKGVEANLIDTSSHNKILLTFNQVSGDINNNPTSTSNEAKNTHTLFDSHTKSLVHQKQNVFLSNELVNLRLKLNKLSNKNKLISNLLKSQSQIKNCKLLDKFISSFIEKLAVNWNEIVELLIDDLLEQEVYRLNELEMEKWDKTQFKATTFCDILKNCQMSDEYEKTLFKENFDEITQLIGKCKENEDLIARKYHLGSVK